ncbi:MAG: transposase [Planctomycetaceae bacterium]|nr:transposase [Planctomycetaceae bacterium]
MPIARAVAILSLATACVIDAVYGPYAGKETGESALLRTLLGELVEGRHRGAGSVLLLLLDDRLVALARHAGLCSRKHHLRHSDFRRGQRLGKYDHLIIWTIPQRPTWMDEATYAQIPATLLLREIRYNVVEPGRRTRSIDVITTLVDADAFTKEEIAQLYGFRWNSELDIRSIKDSLNLGHVRCKSPEMVERNSGQHF